MPSDSGFPAHDPVEHEARARALRRGTPGYPAALSDLPDPPEVLYVQGTLPAGDAVAIVGSRAASPYGIAVAGRLAGDLAALGLTVVSGLARGIDAAAHRGALDRGGLTVAVVPTGLECVVPVQHRDLALEIARSGAVTSELPQGPPRGRGEFVVRNRLIAALARVTLVVEAAERSGALSTAAVARRLGRPVLAVPGDIDRPTSRGTNALLREGALVCLSADDVIRALGAPVAAAPRAKTRFALESGIRADERSGAPGALLLRELTRHPRDVETLAAGAGLALDQTLAALLELEWAGAAVRLPGSRWARSGTAS